MSDLRNSIDKFGFVEPIVVNTYTDRKNVIVGGHQRLRIARELGMKKVPCVEVSLTIEAERELNVRLNKNAGQWDWDKLANEFDMVELIDWGFTANELDGSHSYLDSVSDISLLDEDESSGYSFSIKCDTEEELETVKRLFGAGGKKIAYEEAIKFLCECALECCDN